MAAFACAQAATIASSRLLGRMNSRFCCEAVCKGVALRGSVGVILGVRTARISAIRRCRISSEARRASALRRAWSDAFRAARSFSAAFLAAELGDSPTQLIRRSLQAIRAQGSAIAVGHIQPRFWESSSSVLAISRPVQTVVSMPAEAMTWQIEPMWVVLRRAGTRCASSAAAR